MYTIVLFVTIGVLGGLILAREETLFQKYVLALAGYCFGAAIGTLIGVLVGFAVPMKNFVYGPYKLVALNELNTANTVWRVGNSYNVWRVGNSYNGTVYGFLQPIHNGSSEAIAVVEQVTRDGRAQSASLIEDGSVKIVEDPSLKNTGLLTITTIEPDTTSALYRWSLGTGIHSLIETQQFRLPVGSILRPAKS